MSKLQFLTFKLPVKTEGGNVLVTPKFDPQKLITYIDTDDQDFFSEYSLDPTPYKVDMQGEYMYVIYKIEIPED